MKKCKYSFPSVGHCIYCDATDDLSSEHIIPYGLGGIECLPDSSCPRCRKTTGAFENRVLRGMYGYYRLRNNFQTGHPEQRTATWDTRVQIDTGEEVPVSLPIESIPGVLPLAHFNVPGFLRNPPVKQVDEAVFVWQLRTMIPDEENVNPKHQKLLSMMFGFGPQPLAQMLAKIAHSYCVALFGADSFEHWLRPIIKDNDLNFGYLVGGIPARLESPLEPRSPLFQLKASSYKINGQDVLIVHMWYFAMEGNSPNCVVVGALTDKFPRSNYFNHS